MSENQSLSHQYHQSSKQYLITVSNGQINAVNVSPETLKIVQNKADYKDAFANGDAYVVTATNRENALSLCEPETQENTKIELSDDKAPNYLITKTSDGQINAFHLNANAIKNCIATCLRDNNRAEAVKAGQVSSIYGTSARNAIKAYKKQSAATPA